MGDRYLMVIAFMIPNAQQVKKLSSFMVSVDVVEKETGIDFFAQLPIKEQEESLEKAVQEATLTSRYFL